MGEVPADVEAYLASQPADVRDRLEQARAVLHAAVPGLTETISYGMPTFELDGQRLVHLAGWKRHISLYPAPDGDPDLEAVVGPYRSGRGTLKLPLAQPLPEDVVRLVVRRLVELRGAEPREG
ncbi:iron chaperone [Angustibacter peucedani]